MELNRQVRSRIALPTSLRQGNALLGWFTTRDLGPDGISLRGKVPGLAADSIVTVSVELQQFNTIVTRNLKAVVVAQDAGCIGLRWLEHQRELNELLPHEDCLAA